MDPWEIPFPAEVCNRDDTLLVVASVLTFVAIGSHSQWPRLVAIAKGDLERPRGAINLPWVSAVERLVAVYLVGKGAAAV